MPRLQDQAGAPLIPAHPDEQQQDAEQSEHAQPSEPFEPSAPADGRPAATTAAGATDDVSQPVADRRAEPDAQTEPDPHTGADAQSDTARTPDPRRRRRLFILLAGIAVVAYVLDQLSKAWAIANLTDQPPTDLVGSFLRLELIRNPGAAFSIGTGNTWVLTLIALVVLVVVVRTSRRLGSVGWAWAMGLLLGGALGNLTDRIIREPGFGQGHVVDFINYNGLFIGNVADIAIVSAAILIGLLALTGRRVDGTREERTPTERGRHEAHSDDGA